MHIKMIVADLDGTLLKRDKTLSPVTLCTLKKCREAGILFTVATGRSRSMAKPFMEELNPDGAVLHNGALVCYMGSELKHTGIDKTAAAQIFSGISKIRPDIALAAEAGDGFFSDSEKALIWNKAPYGRLCDIKDEIIEEIIVGATSMDEMQAFSQFIPDDLFSQVSENRFGMIMRRDADKCAGVKAISEASGISLSEIAAFGDDYNDIGMISLCGFGIAMGNAIDEVKSSADFVCQSNDCDGVAKWLEQYIL